MRIHEVKPSITIFVDVGIKGETVGSRYREFARYSGTVSIDCRSISTTTFLIKIGLGSFLRKFANERPIIFIELDSETGS